MTKKYKLVYNKVKELKGSLSGIPKVDDKLILDISKITETKFIYEKDGNIMQSKTYLPSDNDSILISRSSLESSDNSDTTNISFTKVETAKWSYEVNDEAKKIKNLKCKDKEITSFDPNLDFPEYDLLSIGDHAFENCINLATVSLPDSVEYIGQLAFWKCSSISSLKLPDSLTEIGYKAFFYCTGLTSIEFPNSLTRIEEAAFADCTSLTGDIIIPENVEFIGSRIFNHCGRLTIYSYKAYKPENWAFNWNQVSTYDNSISSHLVFWGYEEGDVSFDETKYSGIRNTRTKKIKQLKCKDTSITDFNFEDDFPGYKLISVGMMAFSNCSNLTAITLPNTLVNMGIYAFAHCTNLSSIVLPNSVREIGDSVFYNCPNLTAITIPEGVISIGTQAFLSCRKLKDIVIPSSVTSIGTYAFASCINLKSISVKAENIIYDSRNNCNAIIETATNTLIKGCDNTVMPAEITAIGEGAFDSCINLESITIPDHVTRIGNGAFSGCEMLKNITIPASITEIPKYMFRSCYSIRSIVLPNSIIKINENVFDGCYLTSLFIPKSVTNIGNNLLGNGSFGGSLDHVVYSGTEEDWKKIIIAENNDRLSRADKYYNISTVNYVENDKMHYLELDGTDVILEWVADKTITEFDASTYFDNKKVISIEGSAFSNCANLTKMIIPNGVTCIKDHTFDRCSSLSDIIIPESVIKIEYSSFTLCTSLRYIKLPNKLEIIDANTFPGCSNLSSIVIPKSVTKIGKGAFDQCYSLEIFCEATSKPEGWDPEWNSGNNTVRWGYVRA